MLLEKWATCQFISYHYVDVIMGAMASQITGVSIVCAAVCSGTRQIKHHSSVSLAFVRGITGDRWIPLTKGQWRGKCFHLMTPSCDFKSEYPVCITNIMGQINCSSMKRCAALSKTLLSNQPSLLSYLLHYQIKSSLFLMATCHGNVFSHNWPFVRESTGHRLVIITKGH